MLEFLPLEDPFTQKRFLLRISLWCSSYDSTDFFTSQLHLHQPDYLKFRRTNAISSTRSPAARWSFRLAASTSPSTCQTPSSTWDRCQPSRQPSTQTPPTSRWGGKNIFENMIIVELERQLVLSSRFMYLPFTHLPWREMKSLLSFH